MLMKIYCQYLHLFTCDYVWQVHLSDNVGMEILTWLLWDATSLQLQAATPEAPASPKTSPPVERPVPPNLVVVRMVYDMHCSLYANTLQFMEPIQTL